MHDIVAFSSFLCGPVCSEIVASRASVDGYSVNSK